MRVHVAKSQLRSLHTFRILGHGLTLRVENPSHRSRFLRVRRVGISTVQTKISYGHGVINKFVILIQRVNFSYVWYVILRPVWFSRIWKWKERFFNQRDKSLKGIVDGAWLVFLPKKKKMSGYLYIFLFGIRSRALTWVSFLIHMRLLFSKKSEPNSRDKSACTFCFFANNNSTVTPLSWNDTLGRSSGHGCTHQYLFCLGKYLETGRCGWFSYLPDRGTTKKELRSTEVSLCKDCWIISRDDWSSE